jgi:hypothetical protein
MLFFPITKENAKIINYVLEEDSKFDANTNVLGIYKTMVDSWQASDRYLSGIIMDTIFSDEVKDDVLMIRLALSDLNGDLDSLVACNFLHAILLAAMESAEIIVSDKLIMKMLPDPDEEMKGISKSKKNKKDPNHFPEDKKIMNIAKKIMTGKIKDNDTGEEDKDSKDKKDKK